ncbi:cysteine-rich venom protein 2-like [Leptidea sinapis]|uniref:cysteine-rich venom protein 2-like n=1 Tax=Leptidea sinapis TaxID=189913 RepID=UPI00213468D7|nr:cysteine-rich venom protein 2-like [Leptidea sinapis]XP_050670214.1 cysteine-rich venom protein 2-like [Leptidea sinapis]
MYSQKGVWLFMFIFYNTLLELQCAKKWDEKQLFPSSKIPEDGLSPRRLVVRRKIVLYHNFFRTKVRPTASNMLLMSWHPIAARQAQNYADRCIFLQHNDARENTVPYLGSCGQNLFVASQKTPWFFATKTWFLEYKNFTYGAPVRNLKAVGHYTQMVWATSHKVGCGVAHCAGGPWGHFYNYVCHYCPAGNINTIIQYPYKIGKSCEDCEGNCISGALCANSCPVKDFFSNCDDLVKISNACQQGMCNATCSCGSKRLHKNYPW